MPPFLSIPPTNASTNQRLFSTPLPLIERQRDEIIELVHSHRARYIAVFGSVARGGVTSDSDDDLLVEFDPSSSLLDLIDLVKAMSELLGVSVDVISTGALPERPQAEPPLPPDRSGPAVDDRLRGRGIRGLQRCRLAAAW